MAYKKGETYLCWDLSVKPNARIVSNKFYVKFAIPDFQFLNAGRLMCIVFRCATY